MAGTSSTSAPHATSSAQAAQAAQALLRAQAQIQNVNQTKYFGAAVGGLIVLCIILHWARLATFKSSVSGKLFRSAQSFVIRKPLGFSSNGHGLLFLAYFSINLILLFTNLPAISAPYFAKRFGWLCISNLVLLTFLALRNTPLAFLTAYSYERLNSLHQIAGYTTILCAVLHGSLQSVTFVQAGESFVLLETGQIVGIIAVLSFIITGLVATILRPVQYEIFYIIHVTMFMLTLITIGMHRPQLSQQVLYWIIISGALWFTDRLIRGSRILWNMRHNAVSLTPLPGRGIRLSLSRPLYRATPGSHVFLWVPSIRAFETHPFTIASVDPLELVIKAHDGFTGELLAQAEKNPSQSLIASVDGPYGTLPDFTAFDRVVLVAGGSGASFTFGVAINLLRQRGDNTTMSTPTIEFLWTVRHPRMLSWFQKELSELEASPHVNVHLRITGSSNSSSTSTQGSSPISTRIDRNSFSSSLVEPRSTAILSTPTSNEKMHEEIGNHTVTNSATDIEKQIPAIERKDSSPQSSKDSNFNFPVGRPDINAFIKENVRKANITQNVVVAVCGPAGLSDVARIAVAECLLEAGPAIQIHCEQFGW